ncbi:TetR/AcrR family transcriptional regulator [Streptomyces pacificus]|uniref:TetR/AcrR family transcriptional regulator n=1 Tax=Streptomyces pacificus TaxID=2705029 RepID=A0A6A0AW12_9ACTN|nr:TetR/AcrR family transcriptional regulator [Streptomyces pacificus]GFH36848.1 TetR/AcrR family transcriptional regulator [Streptomyces pacificus]
MTRSSLDLLWGTGERPSRGPKPGLSLDRITGAAVAVADAEGLEAVSMRRVAAELGVGTMSLYRYVPGKAELLDLMLDRVQADSLAAAPPPAADWRDAVRALAHGHRNQLHRHPWLLRVNEARSALGPNTLRGLEVCLSGLRDMGLTDPEKIAVIVTVQSFVTGTVRTEIQVGEAAVETGASHDEFWERQRPYLERAMTSGEFPHMAALSEDAFAPGLDSFGFGLDRLLEGFESLVARRAPEGTRTAEADGRGSSPDEGNTPSPSRGSSSPGRGKGSRPAGRKGSGA